MPSYLQGEMTALCGLNNTRFYKTFRKMTEHAPLRDARSLQIR